MSHRTGKPGKPLKGLMILLLFLLPGLVAPIPAVGSPAGEPVAREAAEKAQAVTVQRAKATATLSVTQTIDSRGRIRLTATSNAKNVIVVYRTAGGSNRRVTARFREGVARVTLPARATGIMAATKATSRLTSSPLVVVTPPQLPTMAPRRASPGPVTQAGINIRAENSLALGWVNPWDRDLLAVVVYQSAAGPGPGMPWDHVTVLPSKATSFRDTELAPGKQYTYVIVTVDRDLNAGAAVRLTSSTLPDTTPPGPVASVNLGTVTRNSVELTWLDPPAAWDLYSIQVRRSVGARPPATVTDGTLLVDQVWTGPRRFVDTGLTPGTQYSYSVFALDFTGNASPPVSLTATTITVWAMISTGDLHTCALDSNGVAWCWGYGYLGNGTATESTTPVRVAGGHTFTTLDAGAARTCAVDALGATWCWGANLRGFLGDGTFGNQLIPVPIATGLNLRKLSVADTQSCALDASGAAWCWGDNAKGQMGNATVGGLYTTPARVAGGHTFTAVSSGREHTCALDTNGLAWCWGSNERMQLGDGTTVDRATPVAVSGGRIFTTLATSYDHTCALDVSGAAWCWGVNPRGQLGDSVIIGATPIPVSGGLTFTSLAVGFIHSCGLDRAGATWCWGANDAGQLGDGSTNPQRTTPAPVVGGRVLTSLVGSGQHNCGLDVDGRAWCWGWNIFGQLGDGTQTSRNIPVAVVEPAQ